MSGIDLSVGGHGDVVCLAGHVSLVWDKALWDKSYPEILQESQLSITTRAQLEIIFLHSKP